VVTVPATHKQTNPQRHRQDRLQYTAQCNNADITAHSIATYRVVDSDSLARRQRQTEQGRSEPVDVRNGRHGVFADRFVAEEHRAVENQDHVCDLAAEDGHVAHHREPVGVLHRLDELVVTASKLANAPSKLAAAAQGTTEVLVHRIELVVQNADNHVVHRIYAETGPRCNCGRSRDAVDKPSAKASTAEITKVQERRSDASNF